MLRNFFAITFRNIVRNKMASSIKIVSLSVGMVCFAILSLFVHREFAFDDFHKHPERIFRVVKDFVNEDGSTIPDATTPPALALALARDLPGIAAATRMIPGWGEKYLIEVGDKKNYEENITRIDSSFFNVFTFPFIAGDPGSALADPNFILVTESTAKRYFGTDDPMGKTITINWGKTKSDFIIKGVLRDVPETSHFTFDILISVRTFQYAALDTDWNWYNYYTYVRLKPEARPDDFASQLQPLYKRYNPEGINRFYVQPISDIHLKSKLKWELRPNGDEAYVRILATIAIFVVLLAMINYINLVTAQSAKRAKEVGIRKTSGAAHSILIGQFLLESMVLALISTVISIAAAEALFPFFEPIFNASLSFLDPPSQPVLFMLLGVGIGTGLVAGIYPAFFLASFKPAAVLKGSVSQKNAASILRKGLVTFQFIISTILIIGSLVITDQIEFMHAKNLGFDKENIVMINNVGGLKNIDALLDEFKNTKGVINAGGANGVLGGQNWTTYIENEARKNSMQLNLLNTDYNFLDVMGVGFTEGRNFSRSFGTDSAAVILNETAVRQLGLSLPAVGSRIVLGEDDNRKVQYSTIIGVINDFHFSSFHEPIKPFGFFLYQPRVNTLFIKIKGDDVPGTIASITGVWSRLIPERPFEFTFQDEQVQKLYASEVKFQKLFAYFTIVAILIACLGLLGLSAYTAQQRIKEIGIRKVLGASVMGITRLLSKEFLVLVGLAILLATPLAWYLMQRWLQEFAYHIEIGVGLFVVAGSLAMVIAGITVSVQAMKAANANPVDSLRNE